MKEENVSDQLSPITDDESFSNETISVDKAPVVTFEAEGLLIFIVIFVYQQRYGQSEIYGYFGNCIQCYQ